MNYVKNLVKILLFAQCFLFSTCEKKESTIEEQIEAAITEMKATEVEPTEEQKLNLADFVKFPFKEKFDNKTNLEKYVLKKFGKPDSLRRKRDTLGEHSEVIADYSYLEYKNYDFEIIRGVNKRFKCFNKIFLLDFIDLKYGINKDTTIKEIEGLFGKSKDFTDVEDSYIINYDYEDNSTYFYRIRITFGNKKLDSITIRVNIADYKL